MLTATVSAAPMPTQTAYDVPIGANQAIELGKGLTLDAADLIRVYATLATLSFGVFGEEIT